jgi:tripartite-type tricarboxylate transporter receptor subunit TctC
VLDPALGPRLTVHSAALTQLRTISTKRFLRKIGMISPDDFARMIAAELQRWPTVVKLAGIQPE